MSDRIDINPEFREALRLMEDSDGHVFVTGRAGTGKSTLLQHWRGQTKKKAVVLAPTGVAALNVRGETIHSFFGFRPDVTVGKIRKKGRNDEKAKLIRKLDAIVVDEISMVRADLLDCMDASLRLHGRDRHRPFGGTRMILIGDLHQLQPVVTREQAGMFNGSPYVSPHFFSAHVFGAGQLPGVSGAPELATVELKKIYRQTDREFIGALESVRSGRVEPEHLDLFNTRFDPRFEPDPEEFWIQLTTTNARADAVNERQISLLKGKPWSNKAAIAGELGTMSFPTGDDLSLKEGAQVMFVNNDREGRWVNGTVGRVAGFERYKKEPDVVLVELEDGDVVDVLPNTWEAIRWEYDERAGAIESDVVGSFTQYPLRLAWAVTIHKSQGKTFDRVVLDLGTGAFAPGQTYVALSRCRTLGGLVLKQPLKRGHVFTDERVNAFLRGEEVRALPRPSDKEMADIAERLREAVREARPVEMEYTKADGGTNRRVITPSYVGEIEFGGQRFMGMRGHCRLRDEERTFRLDRVVSVNPVGRPKKVGAKAGKRCVAERARG